MALMERVTTLLRANLKDLIDKAKDPEKMLKQLVLNMENQLLQVKLKPSSPSQINTFSKKSWLNAAMKWKSQAAFAVAKGRDDLAREALERSLFTRKWVRASLNNGKISALKLKDCVAHS